MEKSIIDQLHRIATDLNYPMLCKFWYEHGQLELTEIGKFVAQYETKLTDIGSKIMCIYEDTIPERDNWFHLTAKQDVKMDDNFRYRCIYDRDNLKTMVIALFGFEQVVKFLVGSYRRD